MNTFRKPYLALVLLVISVLQVRAQTDWIAVKNIATFCKVWGFLKYYHPKVAKGKFNWDAEFTIMAIQTAPNVISIGSPTAGADGNISEVVFPGNTKTYFSGLGIYYPDGRETQRVGIVPDIEVKPTILGIKQGRDEVLERALRVIHEKLD